MDGTWNIILVTGRRRLGLESEGDRNVTEAVAQINKQQVQLVSFCVGKLSRQADDRCRQATICRRHLMWFQTEEKATDASSNEYILKAALSQ